MFLRALPLGLVLFALIATAGCRKLESARPFEFYATSEMTSATLPFRDAIPASYGALVAVTSSASHPTWAQAWFLREDQTITIVWINARNGALVDRVVMIPRK